MPQIEEAHSWTKTHAIWVMSGVGFLLIGIGGIFAVSVLQRIGFTKQPPRPSVIYASPQTAAQMQAAKNAVRADGTIFAIADTEITMTLTGQPGQLKLKLTDKTKYMHGKRGATAEKSTLVAGQKAIAAYDKSTLEAASIWGGYDE